MKEQIALYKTGWDYDYDAGKWSHKKRGVIGVSEEWAIKKARDWFVDGTTQDRRKSKTLKFTPK